MAVAIADIVSRVAVQLGDEDHDVWFSDELTQWVHDAQRHITLLVPGATAKSVTLRCVAGPRQQIPDDGARLIRVQGNTPTADGAPEIIKNVDDRTGRNSYAHEIARFTATFQARNRKLLYGQQRTATQQFSVYTYDPKSPQLFWLYPAALDQDPVDIVYSAIPDTTEAAVNIGLPDYYSPLITDYVLSRCYGKETTLDGHSANERDYYYKRYEDGVKAKLAADEISQQPTSTPFDTRE